MTIIVYGKCNYISKTFNRSSIRVATEAFTMLYDDLFFCLKIVISKVSAMHYQILHYDIFDLCRKRKIKKTTLLLLIYLRGLGARFGSEFYWKDTVIQKDLGISRNTLRRARQKLQEGGILEFIEGTGGTQTHYILLGSIILPEKKEGSKRPYRGVKTNPRGGQNEPPYIYSKQESKQENDLSIDKDFKRFDGMTETERNNLKTLGLINEK